MARSTPILPLSILLVATACGGSSTPAPRTADRAADAQDSKGGTRVAVVDVDRVLSETPQGETVRQQLGAAKKRAEKRLTEMRDRMKGLSSELSQMRSSGDADQSELASRQRELTRLQQQTSRAARSLQRQLQQGRKQLLAPVMDQLSKTAGAIAQQKGYDLVLDRKTTPYSADEADMTDTVIEAMRDKAGQGRTSTGTGTSTPQGSGSDSGLPTLPEQGGDPSGSGGQRLQPLPGGSQ